jgi:Dolichyl-phosphate-mannose-protein mannosyltransferase
MARPVAIPDPSPRLSRLRREGISVSDALSRSSGWLIARITDERLIVLLATLISACAYAWYASRGLVFGYGDALSRMEIARRVLVSRTPGLAQLGTTWLPLHPMLMLPLIWNNTLFHDGFAGSFPSMVAYVISSLYMYRTVRLVFSARAAAWVAALAFMLNPSVVYMQATAMSEVPMICTATLAIYYMLAWARSYHAVDVVKSGAAVAAGTGIRYDGWPLAAVFAVFVVYIAWRNWGYQAAQAWGIVYSLIAFSGCAAWVIYNQVIFHDPLLFVFFLGSSSNTTVVPLYPSYHHAWLSFEMYAYSAGGMVGLATTVLAVVGLIIFVVRYRLQASMLPVYGLLVPFAFYWVNFYMGWDTILLPQLGLSTYWNARFGLQLVPAMAFFLGYLATLGRTFWRRVSAGVTLAVVVWFAVTNSIGQTIPFAEREPLATSHGTTPKVIAQSFIRQYHGGAVLISYIPSAPTMFYMMQHIPDHNFITDANGWQYKHALKYPQLSVKWIVMEQNDTGNSIWVALHNRQVLHKYFVLKEVVGGSMFYERNARPSYGP